MIRDIIEAFRRWLDSKSPQLQPIPVRPENKSGSSEHPKFTSFNYFSFLGAVIAALFLLSEAAFLSHRSDDTLPAIVFLGDSLTAGYGIDESQAYPSLIQQKLQEKGKNWRVVNAGLSGETSAGGLRRINWLLRSRVDVLVLGLGANDGLRGIDLATTEQNLQQIIDRTRERYPNVKIVIAGMQVPPNLGETYTRTFREMFPRLASTNKATLIPFLLEDVAGIPSLNLPDGIHPTPEGHKIMANTVWKHLEPLL